MSGISFSAMLGISRGSKSFIGPVTIIYINSIVNILSALDQIHSPNPYFPNIHDIRKWHGILNELLFDGILPKFYDINIKKFSNQFAAVVPCVKTKSPNERVCKLEINPEFTDFKSFIIILCHECIHQWQWHYCGKVDHGKSFFQWKERLKNHGIPLAEKYHKKLLDIPVIK
jgi:hypothetical protein